MARAFTEDDEGKTVVTADGDDVGMVTEVRGETAYVDADSNTFETVKSKLGWGDVDEDTYPLEHGQVDAITDDEVQLSR